VSEKNKPTYKELQERVVALEQLVARIESRFVERDKIIATQAERIKTLEDELAKYKKNSSNSSKPPSSDIVKLPRETQDGAKRKIGAQPGHPKHERPLFSGEQIDNVINHRLDACPGCGGALLPSDAAPRVIQQIEIIEKPVRIDEHRGTAYWCPACQKIHYAPLPPEVERGGLAGPRLTALTGYMKGGCHASYSTVQAFLDDALGVALSRGQLCKLVGKAAAALDVPYQELRDRLPTEARLNVDETGHRENHARFWTWCFRAELFVLFKIDKSRGSKVLIDALGEEFNGVLGCDYFTAYRKYMGDCGILVQFCLAHLIRDVKFLLSLFDHPAVAYGKRLLAAIHKLFSIIHHRDVMSPEYFQRALAEQREAILSVATAKVPRHKAARNMANRFLTNGDAYFRFITTPGVEPTNNIAEQAIRFVVIDRLVTQGTRSERGRRWCERIWTVMATCAIHNRSPFEFVLNAINANFTGSAPPSLLPAPP
jgi:transposase